MVQKVARKCELEMLVDYFVPHSTFIRGRTVPLETTIKFSFRQVYSSTFDTKFSTAVYEAFRITVRGYSCSIRIY
jgi:hypothetical protein